MKKIAILMILMCCWIGISQASADGKPSIVMPVKVHDFGTIKEKDGPVSCEFRFTNTGNAPLVIISAHAPCGCTKPVYPDAPIAAGRTASIKVTYDPKRRPGEFNKNVTIRTNDPSNKKINLKITGVVVP